MKKLIQNVSTLEELKQIYKKLALVHHPDCGGNERTMVKLNNEYDELFEQLKNTHKNKEGEFYSKETTETPKEWRDLINQLLALKMVEVIIEVIGSFVWVSGNTKPYKTELYELDLKWSHKKSAWYKSPKGYRKFGKKIHDMNDIRGMYGSKQVRIKEKQKRINA